MSFVWVFFSPGKVLLVPHMTRTPGMFSPDKNIPLFLLKRGFQTAISSAVSHVQQKISFLLGNHSANRPKKNHRALRMWMMPTSNSLQNFVLSGLSCGYPA